MLKRIFGISATRDPQDKGCWMHRDGRVEIEWARAPELQKPCGAIRLEGRGLPHRILVVYGLDGEYHAFQNRCSHLGRRLDPVHGGEKIRCCSISNSVFDYSGNIMSGRGKGSLKKHRIEQRKCKLIIWLNQSPS
jgi:nitrite reductase/ring-hydroxylating ferredoxin subunit